VIAPINSGKHCSDDRRHFRAVNFATRRLAMAFELQPRLVSDFHQLGRCGPLHVLLQRNAMLPWFIIVPESNALELFELTPELRRELESLADKLARFVKRYFACDKINVAAIGNIVPQLHLHVIGRRRDDCCWPQAAWGHVQENRAYTEKEIQALTTVLTNDLALELNSSTFSQPKSQIHEP
jgi:diadenosine tetraphosphate (Ap4A) HIT family hydrolase